VTATQIPYANDNLMQSEVGILFAVVGIFNGEGGNESAIIITLGP
jgi:hypothetical protein